MTAQPLTPVIPSSGGPAVRQRARSTAGRPLPLACPEPVPSVPDDVVYGIGRIDASGRIADRAVTSALGWSGGDPEMVPATLPIPQQNPSSHHETEFPSGT